MNKTKEILITGFALFAMFFGAGDLILPPFLGFQTGLDWGWVALGFVISAVAIPILGLFAHAKLQGTMLDFANKFSPKFSLVYCMLVYLIAVILPAPRTAAVTHEMAIMPYFEISALTTSFFYFGLVLVFVWNRSIIIDWIGKYLTPLIVIILLLIIGLSFFVSGNELALSTRVNPFSHGMLEGYQTFGAIAAIVSGGIIIISLNKKNSLSYTEKKVFIFKASIVAGIGLLLVFTGLILTGALLQNNFNADATRTEILSGISLITLGNNGRVLLSLLISLACFTTAVGVITGTADFIKGIFKESQLAYRITAILACLIGVFVGQLNVGSILTIAVPVLLFIYPITIIMIFLHTLPNRLVTVFVFRTVILTTLLFSVPDVLGSLQISFLQPVQNFLPLGIYNVGWLLPAFVVFLLANVFQTKKRPV
ncbi:MAG: branched-chain amino acid ABC transporter substrate-binding protein [Flavobacteriaceae bacterium CG_4_8_14_3_um_filter_34_10]|nr:MAG: branched-chain amino acid ABC transporter substrate-binding protein [Flavobacteriaceae bacterium CG_4_8_14_3_um_filter_34_10]PJC08628.1 MAG: branched-chain amino acid ABC transporter substrate-binding protein [Flavobacteriaceae bacterium CG_4_9_14_0_8_um_filter_34_30]